MQYAVQFKKYFKILANALGQSDFERFGEGCDAHDCLLCGQLAGHGGQEGEVLQQRREEEEELGPGECLPQALPPAHGEGDEVLLPPDRARNTAPSPQWSSPFSTSAMTGVMTVLAGTSCPRTLISRSLDT